jgi:hypothetical protein
MGKRCLPLALMWNENAAIVRATSKGDSMIRTFTRHTITGLALLVSATGAGAATDAETATEAFVAAIEARGDAVASFETTEMSDGILTISGLMLTDQSRPDRVVSLPSVVISGIVERENGGFVAARFAFDGGFLTDGSQKISWTSALAEGVIVPGPEEIKSAAKLRPLQRLSMTGIAMAEGAEAPVISVGELTLAIGEVIEGESSRLVLDARDMEIGVDLAGGARRKALLRALGYERINMDLHLESTVDLEADTWDLAPLIMQVDKVGDFHIEGRFSGISLGGFATSSRRLAASEAARIDRFAMRFENGGLIERALDMQAGMMGVERAQFVEQFLGAVPFMLNFIGNPPFQAKLAAAANDFLRDPRTLTISSSPDSPVALLDILGAALLDHSVLPDLLAVEISANN